MRKCKNHHELRGYIGKTPVFKVLKSGGKVARFSVATKISWKDKDSGEWKEKTEWHQVEAWNLLADRVEKWFERGDFVNVEGLVEHKKWTKDGKEHQMTVIKATDLSSCDKKEVAAHYGISGMTDVGTDSESEGQDVSY